MDFKSRIDACMIPQLSKPYDESSNHAEFKLYKNGIFNRLSALKSYMLTEDFSTIDKVECYSSVVLLIEELKTDGQWRPDCSQQFIPFLNEWIENSMGGEFYSCFRQTFGRNETVYLACIRKIHDKLVKEKWKYFPSAVHAYQGIINYLEFYDVGDCPLPLLIPASLTLLDDYQTENKIIGMKCCTIILKFNIGKKADLFGFEKVIFDCILKHLRFRDEDVLAHTIECLEALLPGLNMDDTKHHSSKWTVIDDVIEILTESIYVESNMVTKKLLLRGLKSTFAAGGIAAIRWSKKFMEIFADNLESCTDNTTRDEILPESIQCFEEWLKSGWTVWSYWRHTRIFELLLKILYISHMEKTPNRKVIDFLVKLCNVCVDDERNMINIELGGGLKEFENDLEFANIVKEIKTSILL